MEKTMIISLFLLSGLILFGCEGDSLAGKALAEGDLAAVDSVELAPVIEEPVPVIIETTCFDSDKPADIFTSGYVEGIDQNGKQYKHTDYCGEDGITIYEYQCAEHEEVLGKFPITHQFKCPDGSSCQDRSACFPTPDTPTEITAESVVAPIEAEISPEPEVMNKCTDTDNGIEYSVAGEITGFYNGNQFKNADWCKEDGVTLIETYCNFYNGYPVPATSPADCIQRGYDACVDNKCVHDEEPEPEQNTLTLHRHHLYCGSNKPVSTSPNGGLNQEFPVGEGTNYWNFKCYNREREQCSVVEKNVLVLDLDFDGGLGSSVRQKKSADSTSQIYNAVWTEGYEGQGMKFDGSSYIRIPNDPSLQMDRFTIEMYIKFTSDPTTWSGGPYWTMLSKEWDYIYRFWKGYDENGYGRGLSAIYFSSRAIEHANAYMPGYTYTGKAYPGHESTEFKLEVGKWYKMEMTYDGSFLTSKINGDVVAKTYSPYVAKHSSVDLMIGSHLQSGSYIRDGFIGVMDEIKIWNIVKEMDTSDSYYMEWCEDASGNKVDMQGNVLGPGLTEFPIPASLVSISQLPLTKEIYTSNVKQIPEELEPIEIEIPIKPIPGDPEPIDPMPVEPRPVIEEDSLTIPQEIPVEPFPVEPQPQPIPQHIPAQALSMESSEPISPAIPDVKDALEMGSLELPQSEPFIEPINPPTHLECYRYSCREVKGLGDDECSSNRECRTTVTPELAKQVIGAQEEPKDMPMPVEPREDDDCRISLFGWCIVKVRAAS